MADVHIEVLSIAQELEPTPTGRRQLLHELLFFPEFDSFGEKLHRLQTNGRKLAKTAAGRMPLDDLHRRHLPEEYEVETLTLSLEPTRSQGTAWSKPVELELPVIKWRHGTDASIAYVPALGIEVVDSKGDRLDGMLKSHVEFAIRRRGIGKSLLELAYLQRGRTVEIERLAWNATPDTAKERYEKVYGNDPDEESVLKGVATKLTPSAMPVAYEREADVGRLLLLLTGRKPSSVLMVGPSGVGKTAVLKELVRTKVVRGLSNRVFWQTSGGRIVAGQVGFGMWQKRCGEIVAEAKSENAIVFLGNLFELMQVGQSTATTESIGAYLRPAMIRGDLLAVVECTPEQLNAIETNDPKILDAFRTLQISEPDRETGRKILDQISLEIAGSPSWYEEPAIARIDALHRRYSSYSAYPGRAAWFLKNLRTEIQDKRAITEKDVIGTFSKETGLPLLLLDDAVPFDSTEVTGWMRERVMAQDKATALVVDTIATIKARLSRPKKPLASFMFIGPTGVGKTELAKTLAEFLYGSKERMIRFDMSEYSASWSAQRLVSTAFDEGEGLLTAAVREEPFSVILLDEFEKAAPEVYDLFLQVLGEGRLTDAAGRLADFTNAVIIMTSNLGAASYGKGALGFDAGDTSEAEKAVTHFEEAVKAAVRPEFFNRIDKVVPFLPLEREAVARIADRELVLAMERDGLAGASLRLEIEPTLLEQTIEAGYDLRYGARPMKRAIEQRLLLPLGDFLNCSPRQDGVVTLRLSQGGEVLAKFVEDSDAGEDASKRRRIQSKQAEEAAERRRDFRLLSDSPMVQELRSEAFRIEQIKTWEHQRLNKEAKSKRKKKKSRPNVGYVPFDKISEKRLEQLQRIFKRIDVGLEEAVALEEQLLLAFISGESSERTTSLLESVEPFEPLLLDTYFAFEKLGGSVTLILGGDHHGWISELALTYVKVMEELGAKVSGGVFERKPPAKLQTAEEEGVTGVKVEVVSDEVLAKKLRGVGDNTGAVGLQFVGAAAPLWLRQEEGVHVLEKVESDRRRCHVEMLSSPLEEIRLDLAKLQRVPDLKKFAIRRQFMTSRGMWRDSILETKGNAKFSRKLLADLLEKTVLAAAREAL